MDLPTCPACGQSVLDEDAAECPFCGAAMDGSSGAKKQAASTPAAPKKKAKAPKPEDDDPFAIKKAPTTGKVVLCAPKPMKGRLHRVVCPMCDAQGFIPKKAIGMQVKCPNKECLIPVFEATDGKEKDKPRAPSRVSDEELSRPAKDASLGDGKKPPLMLYGIVAAVLLAATMGLVFFLNQEPLDELPPYDPFQGETHQNEDPEPEDIEPKKPDVPELPDFRKQAEDIATSMTKTALIGGENRDKVFCRRMTADAFLKLNMSEQAEAEFRQMAVVASQDGRDTAYYQIVPRVNHYWQAIADGDQAAAENSLNAALALKDQISGTVGIAIESAISLAGAMVHSGDIESALPLLTAQRGDVSVSTRQDSVRYAAWLSVADTLREQNKAAWSPDSVFSWHDPLSAAVAVQLAANRKIESAVKWATAQSDAVAVSDALAVTAEFAANSTAETQDKVAAAADAANAETSLRIRSVLAAKKPEWFAKASEVLTRIAPAEPMPTQNFEQVIDAETPDLVPSLLAGKAYADFVVAAVALKNDLAAKDGFDRLYRAMASSVPPTAQVRKVCGAIQDDSRRVKAQIGEELNLRDDSAIRNKFNDYRRGADRLARAAETRHLYVIQLLGHIVQRGGGNAVTSATAAEDSPLRGEVMIDELCGMIFTAGAAVGQDLGTFRKPDSKIAIEVSRVSAVPEASVIQGLVAAWDKFLADGNGAALAVLDGMKALTGLRSAVANFMTEKSTETNTSVSDQLAAVRSLRNVDWRERAMRIIAQTAATNGRLQEAKSALDGTSAAPAGRIMYFRGLLTGLLRFETTETARIAEEAKKAEEEAKQK